MNRKSLNTSLPRKLQSGMSLTETMVATCVLLVATVGVMSMAVVATLTTENQGHLVARTAEYAQDKMEQLISLAWGDSTTDTTVFPANNSGGTGLSVGGGSNPNAPVTTPGTGYVDYLDMSGNPLAAPGGAAPTNWYYIRVWQISAPAGTSNLKQITVTAKVRMGLGSGGAPPQSTVTSLKTNPF